MLYVLIQRKLCQANLNDTAIQEYQAAYKRFRWSTNRHARARASGTYLLHLFPHPHKFPPSCSTCFSPRVLCPEFKSTRMTSTITLLFIRYKGENARTHPVFLPPCLHFAFSLCCAKVGNACFALPNLYLPHKHELRPPPYQVLPATEQFISYK